MFNAEYLSLREPSKTGRYKWVGKLAHNNESLIFICSLLFNILFSVLLFDLIIKLTRKKLKISTENDKLYLNGKYFVSKENIKKIELVNLNNNSSVLLSLYNPKIIVDERDSLLEKIKIKLHLLFNRNKLRINLSLLENQPEINFNKFEKFTNKK